MGYRLNFATKNYHDGAVRYHRDGELVVAENDRFILANIELPVAGSTDEIFVWTCWVSLSHESYDRIEARWDDPERQHDDPAFGYVSNAFPTYSPSTWALKTNVHTRPLGVRPAVELEPTDHRLAVEQRDGISRERILAIYHHMTPRESL